MRQIRELAPDEVERVGAVLGLARLGQGDGYYLVAWEDEEPVGHAHLALTDPPELHRDLGYHDVGIPPRRVHGTIQIRTGPLEVDDTLLTWEKSLDGRK